MNSNELRLAQAMELREKEPKYLVRNPAHKSPARTYRSASKGELIRRVIALEEKLAGLNDSVYKAAMEVEAFRQSLESKGVMLEPEPLALPQSSKAWDDPDTYGPS